MMDVRVKIKKVVEVEETVSVPIKALRLHFIQNCTFGDCATCALRKVDECGKIAKQALEQILQEYERRKK